MVKELREEMGRKRERASFSEVLRGRTQWVVKEGREKKGEAEEGKWCMFQSSEDESAWLKGALTGCLKEQFSWDEHEEELRAECAGKMKLTKMGSNLILIQSETTDAAMEVIKGFGEWMGFWLEWWREWRHSDVNPRRTV